MPQVMVDILLVFFMSCYYEACDTLIEPLQIETGNTAQRVQIYRCKDISAPFDFLPIDSVHLQYT